ncbi:MAG: glycoside hydrolase family 15 protein [Burkholderiales bacterium]|nr:glycoside hydrolase family 15 protein [Burkholderiales bacterium]
MTRLIEDYALIGNQETVALVARDGSIDWMGMPRFDSPPCFAALLGEPGHGRWRIAPAADDVQVRRRYRDGSTVLETRFTTAEGEVLLIDFMSRRDGVCDLMRVVRGVRGRVAMRTEIVVRFDYGSVVPWVSRQDDGRLHFTAGPDRLTLATSVELRGEDMRTLGDFEVAQGDEVSFTLTWQPSWRDDLPAPDAADALDQVGAQWEAWSSKLPQGDEVSEAMRRSLVTLKALAHWQTGGIVAAATTSLPEKIGGTRNWDYRFCWLRDATFTLYALLNLGFVDEAEAWRAWLVRAVAGGPDDLQIMYGVAGERRLVEYEVPWLPGYEGSAPVRVGNAAAGQVQLDVYGEVLDAMYVARKAGLAYDATSWSLECAMVRHLETIWDQPDDGIWEVRGGRRHFVHSKVMAWVAFDRAVRSATEFGLEGPVDHWKAVRDTIHAQVCERGFDPAQGAFVQSYGSSSLDASLLLVAVVGFLPPDDPRMIGTVAAIERRLLRDGLVLRYDTGDGHDGLPPGEGAFLACSFWLADNYLLQDRIDEAQALFDRLLGFRNDVGLLAEEYDPVAQRQLGNFPQAFSHLALINTASGLAGRRGTAHQRASGSSQTKK